MELMEPTYMTEYFITKKTSALAKENETVDNIAKAVMDKAIDVGDNVMKGYPESVAVSVQPAEKTLESGKTIELKHKDHSPAYRAIASFKCFNDSLILYAKDDVSNGVVFSSMAARHYDPKTKTKHYYKQDEIATAPVDDRIKQCAVWVEDSNILSTNGKSVSGKTQSQVESAVDKTAKTQSMTYDFSYDLHEHIDKIADLAERTNHGTLSKEFYGRETNQIDADGLKTVLTNWADGKAGQEDLDKLADITNRFCGSVNAGSLEGQASYLSKRITETSINMQGDINATAFGSYNQQLHDSLMITRNDYHDLGKELSAFIDGTKQLGLDYEGIPTSAANGFHYSIDRFAEYGDVTNRLYNAVSPYVDEQSKRDFGELNTADLKEVLTNFADGNASQADLDKFKDIVRTHNGSYDTDLDDADFNATAKALMDGLDAKSKYVSNNVPYENIRIELPELDGLNAKFLANPERDPSSLQYNVLDADVVLDLDVMTMNNNFRRFCDDITDYGLDKVSPNKPVEGTRFYDKEAFEELRTARIAEIAADSKKTATNKRFDTSSLDNYSGKNNEQSVSVEQNASYG